MRERGMDIGHGRDEERGKVTARACKHLIAHGHGRNLDRQVVRHHVALHLPELVARARRGCSEEFVGEHHHHRTFLLFFFLFSFLNRNFLFGWE